MSWIVRTTTAAWPEAAVIYRLLTEHSVEGVELLHEQAEVVQVSPLLKSCNKIFQPIPPWPADPSLLF